MVCTRDVEPQKNELELRQFAIKFLLLTPLLFSRRRWRCFTDRKNMPIILVSFTYWKSNCEEEKTKNVSYDKWDSNDARRYMYMI